MTEHMRVSVGTAEEMARFMTAFKEIFPQKSAEHGSGRMAITKFGIEVCQMHEGRRSKDRRPFY